MSIIMRSGLSDMVFSTASSPFSASITLTSAALSLISIIRRIKTSSSTTSTFFINCPPLYRFPLYLPLPIACKHLDQFRVKVYPQVPAQFHQGLLMRKSLTVRPVCRHGIKCVGYGKDSGGQRDIFTLQAFWVTTPTIPLVMVLDCRNYMLQGINMSQYLDPYRGMVHDSPIFFTRKTAALPEYRFRYADLSHIMEEAGQLDRLYKLGSCAYRLRNHHAVLCNSPGVAMGIRIFSIYSGRKGLYYIQKHLLGFLVKSGIFQGHCCLAGKGRQELLFDRSKYLPRSSMGHRYDPYHLIFHFERNAEDGSYWFFLFYFEIFKVVLDDRVAAHSHLPHNSMPDADYIPFRVKPVQAVHPLYAQHPFCFIKKEKDTIIGIAVFYCLLQNHVCKLVDILK